MNEATTIAERSVLCAIIENGECIKKVIGILKPLHFLSKDRQEIYQACINLYKSGVTVEPSAILSTDNSWVTEIGLISGTGALSENVCAYAETVIKHCKIRELKALGKNMQNITFDTFPEKQAEAMDKMQSIAADGIARKNISLKEILQQNKDNILKGLSRKGAIKTGYTCLDEKINYMTGGNLYVIGARPGGGKSAFALNIAINIAKKQKRVLYYNAEMTPEEIAERLAAYYTGIPLDNIIKSCIPKQRISTFNSGIEQASTLPIEFGVVPASPNQIINDCLYRDDIAAIIVDYMQIMSCDEKCTGSYEKVTNISQNLKKAAMVLNLPIIALCQLNREIDTRGSNRPKMSDIKNSGQIEQDASVIMLLWDYKSAAGEPRKAVSIAKNRNGICADCAFLFSAPYMRFNEIPGEIPKENGIQAMSWR